MKRTVRILLATMALTVACITPVFATEKTMDAETAMLQQKMNRFSNDITTLVSYDNNCGAADVASMNKLVDQVGKDVIKSTVAEQDNYIVYLKGVLGNAIENERVKKQNVGALTDLVKVNTTFQKQLDAAVAEYNKAVADRQAAEQAITDAKAAFAAFDSKLDQAALAKAAGDVQAVIGK